MQTAHGVPLISTRTTFQRIRDARLFTGRVAAMQADVLVVWCARPQAFVPGDSFAFHIFGHGREALLNARFEQEGESEGATHKYVFHLDGDIQLREAEQEARFLTTSMIADLEIPGSCRCDGVHIVDISAHGICTCSPLAVRKGEPVSLTIHDKDGPISLTAEVRYCVKDKTRLNQHRIGLLVTDMDRVSDFRWKALHHRLVNANRYLAEVIDRKAS